MIGSKVMTKERGGLQTGGVCNEDTTRVCAVAEWISWQNTIGVVIKGLQLAWEGCATMTSLIHLYKQKFRKQETKQEKKKKKINWTKKLCVQKNVLQNSGNNKRQSVRGNFQKYSHKSSDISCQGI